MTTSRPRIVALDSGYHEVQLDGKPFLICAGELGNSAFSSAEYMRTVWPKLTAQKLNTVLGNVTWEGIEPEEGKFTFAELDLVLADARTEGFKVILLWFGAFKNGKTSADRNGTARLISTSLGTSTYSPNWVKKDHKRFPRTEVMLKGQETPSITPTLSVFYQDTIDADAKAYTALMSHLAEIDPHGETVIMIQVENEAGVLGDSRDREQKAEEVYHSPVPKELLQFLAEDWDNCDSHLKQAFGSFRSSWSSSQNPTWPQAFGDSLQTDELFMAYHYARFIEQVAFAGKAIHPIPHFANAWLRAPPTEVKSEDISTSTFVGGSKPGDYPSGGPVETVLDVWMKFAPSLDFLAPDNYASGYVRICNEYKHRNQPLFIPEQRRDEHGAIHAWYAIGTGGAICTSPFGIDTIELADSPWAKHNRLLQKTRWHIFEGRRRGQRMEGFFFKSFGKGEPDPSKPLNFTFGDWNLLVERATVQGHPKAGFGMIIQTATDTFTCIGEGFQIKFNSLNPSAKFVGILRFDEKEIVDAETGKWKTLRMMNGDETLSGNFVIMPTDNPDYGKGFICCSIPAWTRVAECMPYALF